MPPSGAGGLTSSTSTAVSGRGDVTEDRGDCAGIGEAGRGQRGDAPGAKVRPQLRASVQLVQPLCHYLVFRSRRYRRRLAAAQVAGDPQLALA